jgi:cbb3-type cytochrome oxidase subunit 3
MWRAILILALAVLFIAGGLLAFWRNSRQELPKNLPQPLPDEPEDDWAQGNAGPDRDDLKP